MKGVGCVQEEGQGMERVVCGAVCSHRKEGMAAAPHARPSVAEVDPQRMFLEQLLGKAGAF